MTKSSFELDLQLATNAADIPAEREFKIWVDHALSAINHTDPVELMIRIVDEDEAQELNESFAGKTYVPNVLSFPFELPPGCELTIPLIGDIIICAPVVKREAAEQEKSVTAHWAHLTVHGVLHLLGYTHDKPLLAREMESIEVDVITNLGYPHPYETN